jgi:hypothetical protein
MNTSRLPAAVAGYIAATNAFDIDALMTTFSEDALVNDHRNEFVGQAAIRSWAEREIIGDRVTLRITGATVRDTSAAITTVVDGRFDKTGLPDPLVLTFYFTLRGDRIEQLVIVHNAPASQSGSIEPSVHSGRS